LIVGELLVIGSMKPAGLVALVLLALLIRGGPVAIASEQGCPNGRIAFDSLRDGNRDIYAISDVEPVDPSLPVPTPVRLTTSLASDSKPAWSPPSSGQSCRPLSGVPPLPTSILFERTSGGETDIYQLTIGEPGSPTVTPESPTNPAVRIVSNGTAPAWASRGWLRDFEEAPIAFERNVGVRRDIFVVNSDGSGEANLTNSPDIDEANPDWSMDGDLAFDSDRGGRREVWVVDVRFDETAQRFVAGATRKLTDGPGGSSFDPTWFAFNEGEVEYAIAFAGPDVDGGATVLHYLEWTPPGFWPESEIGTLDTFTLTGGADDHSAPVWSPRCHEDRWPPDQPGISTCRLAYHRTAPGGRSDIYVMDPFGDSDVDRRVTDFPGDDAHPDWEAAFPKEDDVWRIRRPRGRRSRTRARQATAVTQPPVITPQPRSELEPEPPRAPSCTVNGTAGDDDLQGTGGPDIICGRGGDDRLRGGRGNDVFRGGSGADIIAGGRGDDRLEGGAGRDDLTGGNGRDHLIGGSGRDTLHGGRGRDTLRARDGARDRVSGGAGRDVGVLDRRRDESVGVESISAR
jgi:hypothetical protein